MRTSLLCGLALLASTLPAFAQTEFPDPACAELPADSLEAGLLDCPPAYEAGQAPAPVPPADDGSAAAAHEALVHLFAAWLERHPIGGTVAPSQARLLEAPPPGLPDLPDGQRYAELDGMIVALGPDWTLLDLVRRAQEAAAPAPDDEEPEATEEPEREAEEPERQEEGQGAAGRALAPAEAEALGIRVPRGHLPPPGSCRVWFPGRPPGQQPPPGPCDAAVPEGAVLITR